MDAVIAFVDSSDPVWLMDYYQTTNEEMFTRRFRDWGLLRYVFRGIDKYMPYIDNVFLVVAYESQVPSWVNKETVKVVYHKDFVPEEYLPTFNCNVLEAYLWNIPGLGEEFIYFNDDTIIINPTVPEDFFENGLPVFETNVYSINKEGQFAQIVRNSSNLAKLAISPIQFAGDISYQWTNHVPDPFVKSECIACYNKISNFIKRTMTVTRSHLNMNQYLWLAYAYYQNKYVKRSMPSAYFRLDRPLDGLANTVLGDNIKTICINDCKDDLDDSVFETFSELALKPLEQKMPEKSKYEL